MPNDYDISILFYKDPDVDTIFPGYVLHVLKDKQISS